MLDRNLRQRMHALASHDAPQLDAATRGQIARQLIDAAPAVIHRAKNERIFVRAAGVSLAAAAAIALFVGVRGLDGSRTERNAAAAPPGAVRSCESWTTPAGVERGFVSHDGRKLLDLDALASVAEIERSDVALERSVGCETVLSLRSGRIAVGVRDLGGGELRVTTPLGDVSAHGGTFAVRVSAGVLTVETADGSVSVVKAGSEAREVVPHTRMTFSGANTVEQTLDAAAADEIRRAGQSRL